jgi:serine/threonine protein kinase
MTNYMIGKVLQGRYQVVQSLGAGVFGETYVAVDIENPENPKCVVKQLKVASTQPSYLQILRLRFLTETETLKHLGHHKQIPELLSCFEENERFYLVQEFIEGHSMTAELPINPDLGYLWNESEVTEFLQEVLNILDFVHSQGVIHCDVKPENLIRRACDGKLVLIDFGSIQPIDFGSDAVLPIYRIPVTSLGYIPPEQFVGQTQPNSDIYALGMIAIQALTGQTPLQLKSDPSTQEILWRSSTTPVSDYLAAVISQMIRHNHKDRYQSASEVLRMLQQMPNETWDSQTVVDVKYRVSDGDDDSRLGVSTKNSNSSAKSSPLLTGMKVGLAANSLVMGFGVYSIVYNTPAASSSSETETLYKATKQFQSGDLQEAIALAKSIPSNSNVYPEAQTSIDEWEKQWTTADEQYKVAEKAFQEGRWTEVLRAASKMPDNLYWQSKAEPLIEQSQARIEEQTKELLSKAYEKATVKDFSTALNYLRQIPQETSAGELVQKKLAEYNQKKDVRASYLLQKAYNRASDRDFVGAVQFLQQVPKDTPVYTTARVKLAEYTQKQRAQAESQKIASSKLTNSPLDMVEPFTENSSATSLQNLNSDDSLYEVNIR